MPVCEGKHIRKPGLKWYFKTRESPTVGLVLVHDPPAGGAVPRPSCMFPDVHRPAQRVQKLQELRLNICLGGLEYNSLDH